MLQKQFDLKPTKFYGYLYKTYIQQRKYKEAIDVTRKMVKSNDKNIEYRYNLGLVYEKSRDTVLSKKEWQYINDQLKHNEYEVNNYLQRYIEARNWSMAEDLILKYQAKTKNKEAFFSHQLHVYTKQNKLDEAVQLAFSQLEKDQTSYLGSYASYDFLQTSNTAQRLMEKKSIFQDQPGT